MRDRDIALDRITEMFKILADNPYSALWDHIEDFDINGHHVSVKESTQWSQVIIDGVYVPIGGSVESIHVGDQVFSPLEYARYKLRKDE